MRRNRILGRGAVLVGGAAIVVAYLVLAMATRAVSGHKVLPLFEGIGPASPYQWVNPPAAFAAGNIKPKANTTDLTLTGPRQPQFAASADGQCLLNLPPNAFPPPGADPKVVVAIAPLDPATLGPVPSGEVADGNAYRIGLTYQPSGSPVATVASPGDVVLTAPHAPDTMYYSADGQTWEKLSTQPFGDPTQIGAVFNAPGWYLAGTTASRVSGGGIGTGTPAGKKGTGLVAIGVVVGAVLLGIFALAKAARRRRG